MQRTGFDGYFVRAMSCRLYFMNDVLCTIDETGGWQFGNGALGIPLQLAYHFYISIFGVSQEE